MGDSAQNSLTEVSQYPVFYKLIDRLKYYSALQAIFEAVNSVNSMLYIRGSQTMAHGNMWPAESPKMAREASTFDITTDCF